MDTGTVDLIRVEEHEVDGTFGVLRIGGEAFCVTCEPPDKGNRVNVSNIPAGAYTAKRVSSPRFGDTYEITGVPGRSHILFHAGNDAGDTRGCILLASSFGKIKGVRSVTNSKVKFQEFMAVMGDFQEFTLNIIEPAGIGLNGV